MKRNILIVLIIFLIKFSIAGVNKWQVVSDMPVPVSGAVAFTNDSLIYIFGGHNSGDFVTPALMQIYNPVLNSWRMDTVGTLQNSRYGANGGIWQGNAYFFGGQTDNNITNLDVWGLAGNVELAPSNHDDNFNRYFASSEIYNGKIYCFGGYSVNSSVTDRTGLPYIFIYDINSHTVETEITSGYTKELPYYQMITRIRNRIYILGGTFNGVLNTISYFNIESNTLRKFGRMATARYGGTANALGDSAIILIGGWDGRDQVLNSIEIISLKNQGSNTAPSITNLNHARAEHVSVKFGNDLYVFGGRNTSADSDVNAVEKFADFELINGIDNKPEAPSVFKLDNNYPNPFNPSTIISYQLSVSSDVFLKVYDITGKLITTLVNEHQTVGKYKVTFDAFALASGVYFYTLKAGEQSQTKRMMLIR
jgi:N-acetylneuraminic acid mutarotase